MKDLPRELAIPVMVTLERFTALSVGANLANPTVSNLALPSNHIQLARRAKFSTWRSARERIMERRVTKSASREVGIGGESSQRSIIRVGSDLFRFLRGTIRHNR
jgi:hypothetical protein